MLYRGNDDVRLVVYEDHKSPSSFKIPRWKIKVYSTYIPLFSLLCVLIVFWTFSHFKDLSTKIKEYKPELVKELTTQNQDLKNQLQENLELNKELTEKLTKPSSSVGALSFFSSTPGSQDLRNKKLIQIDNFSTNIQKDKIKINFSLNNTRPDEAKLAGYIFVVMKAGTQVSIYPNALEGFQNGLTVFSLGEKFNISRFRPVETEFSRPDITNKLIFFQVVIYNRSGDLMWSSQLGPIENIQY